MSSSGQGHSTSRARARHRLKVGAFALVAIAHFLVLAIFLSGQRFGGVTGGGQDGAAEAGKSGDGKAISMTMISAASLEGLVSAEEQQTDPLSALMAKTMSKVPNLQSRNLPIRNASLEAIIAEADRDKASSQPPEFSAHGEIGGRPNASASSGRAAGPNNGKAGLGSNTKSGDLWSQVEPCWKRALQTSTVPVVVDVTLNPSGLVSAAPKVVSVGNALDDESRRISVERALQAIAACSPYSVRNQKTGVAYRLAFGITGEYSPR